MINKPLCYFYSFNILAIISWIAFLTVYGMFIFNDDIRYASGIIIIYFLAIYYITTFLIFITTFIFERIFSLEIKNKFITQNKIVSILRYTGLLIWLVPLVYFLNMLIKNIFFY